MCCLKYEQDVYEELIALMPKAGSLVKTPDGEGVVEESNLLCGTLKVRLSKNPDALPVQYGIGDIRILKGGSNKRQKGKSGGKAEREEEIDASLDAELFE